MSDFGHLAPAPALASSTPDRSCTTDLVARIHISTSGNQGLNDFEKLLLDGEQQRGFAVLSWGGREGTVAREKGST